MGIWFAESFWGKSGCNKLILSPTNLTCHLPTLKKLLDLLAARNTLKWFCLKEREVYGEILFVAVHCVGLATFFAAVMLLS